MHACDLVKAVFGLFFSLLYVYFVIFFFSSLTLDGFIIGFTEHSVGYGVAAILTLLADKEYKNY